MQADLCEFEANLVYRASSRTAKAVTQRNPISKEKKKEKTTTYRRFEVIFFSLLLLS